MKNPSTTSKGLRTGSSLGAYSLESFLGAGGMGEVYRAKDVRLGRRVAIKVLLPHISTDIEARRRFESEARAIDRDELPARLRTGERIVTLERRLAEQNEALRQAHAELARKT